MKQYVYFLLLSFLVIPGSPLSVAQQPERPIPLRDTVFVEEMTWLEVRDSLKAGKTTIIIPTGGVEQNGPYLPIGKHNYIVRAISEKIARKLGNALVAPVVAFVPEGDIEPPTGHMKFPGTISVSEETYELLLQDICRSFRAHGFIDIVLIGDSGGNQDGMENVAKKLNMKWKNMKVHIHYIPEYYDYDGVEVWLAKQGIKQKDDGLHDDFIISASLAAIDPNLIRATERQKAGKFHINGIELAPLKNTVAWGERIMDFRTEQTVKAIRVAIANKK